MSRILFAWELGSNFGHLSTMLPLALALRGRGHHVEFAVRELPRGEMVLGPHGFAMSQSPVWLNKTPPMAAVPSYAGVIGRCGYHSAPTLAGLVAGWERLLQLTAPDLVVLEHAPTAALAADGAGIPMVRLGTGWSAPPAVTPLPSVAPWSRTDPRRLQSAEARVLTSINVVRRRRNRPPLARLAELFAGVHDALTTFPETDHYGARPGARYWGAISGAIAAPPPPWPAPGPGAAGGRVFGFVDSSYDGIDDLVAALSGLGRPALLYVRDLPPSRARALSTATLAVTAAPVDYDRVVREAALVVCHGGHGSITGALRAGVPLVLLPRQAEQRLLAYRLRAQRLAVVPRAAAAGASRFVEALGTALDAPAHAQAARDFAARHAGHDVARAVAGIADLCEAVLAGGRHDAAVGA